MKREQVSGVAAADTGRTLPAMAAHRSRQHPADVGLGSSDVEVVVIGVVEGIARCEVARMHPTGMLEVTRRQHIRD